METTANKTRRHTIGELLTQRHDEVSMHVVPRLPEATVAALAAVSQGARKSANAAPPRRDALEERLAHVAGRLFGAVEEAMEAATREGADIEIDVATAVPLPVRPDAQACHVVTSVETWPHWVTPYGEPCGSVDMRVALSDKANHVYHLSADVRTEPLPVVGLTYEDAPEFLSLLSRYVEVPDIRAGLSRMFKLVAHRNLFLVGTQHGDADAERSAVETVLDVVRRLDAYEDLITRSDSIVTDVTSVCDATFDRYFGPRSSHAGALGNRRVGSEGQLHRALVVFVNCGYAEVVHMGRRLHSDPRAVTEEPELHGRTRELLDLLRALTRAWGVLHAIHVIDVALATTTARRKSEVPPPRQHGPAKRQR